MDVREKLASHLYRSALAVSPAAIVVARLTHPSGVTWDLGPGMIKVTIAGISTSLTADGTVSDLLSDLGDLGVTTTFADPDLLSIPAAAILQGFGSSASSADDKLEVFTTSLWTLLDAYGSELDSADANLIAALEQLYMNTADGEILDVWGTYFGVARRSGEDDETYYNHIVREVLRPRVNRFAIEAAVFDDTGLLVSLFEPHRKIFRLSVSPLSSDHHLQDGTFWTWNVFQPIYHSPMTFEQRQQVLAIIERNRPAGCLIVGADVQPPTGYVEGHFAESVSSMITLVDTLGVLPFQPGLLSATLFLSNYRERPNSAFFWTENGEIFKSTVVDGQLNLFATLRGWSGSWDSATWNHPSVYGVVTQDPA
ncbi:MAG: hypothetical protein ACJ75S_07335 [Solirubrobacterales bacterium]|jgi:hypothetical protein